MRKVGLERVRVMARQRGRVRRRRIDRIRIRMVDGRRDGDDDAADVASASAAAN